MSTRGLFVVVLAVVVLAAAVEWHARPHARSAAAASPTLTPGVLNPEVTQATIARTICVRGWTSTIRPPSDYTSDLKRRQLRVYGFGGTPSDYQEDHLISLGLGGHPTDERNLWPEPLERALDVDRIEVDLHERVCSGDITLADAQREISRIKHSDG